MTHQEPILWSDYPWERHISRYRHMAPEIINGGGDIQWTPDLSETTRDPRSDVVDAVAAVTGISRAELFGRCRKAPICHARYLIWLMLSARHGMGLSQIGRYFNRDHTTILSGIRKARHWMRAGSEFRAQYDRAVDQMDSQQCSEKIAQVRDRM